VRLRSLTWTCANNAKRHILTFAQRSLAGRGCHVKTSAEAGGNWLRGCGSRGLAGGAPPGWNEKKMHSANMIKHVWNKHHCCGMLTTGRVKLISSHFSSIDMSRYVANNVKQITSFFRVFPGRSLRHTSVYCLQISAEINHFHRRSVLHWWLGTCFRCGTCDTPVGGSLTVTETGWTMSWYVKVSFTSCWLLYMAGSLGQQGHGSRWPASLHGHWNDIPKKGCDVHIRCRDPLWKMAWLNCSLHLRTFSCKRHHIFEPNLHAASLGTKTVFGAALCDSCDSPKEMLPRKTKHI
jgi:hypothetical protein